jgi:aspartyl protease family protein
MLFLTWIGGLAVLALFFQGLLSNRENPNRDIEVTHDAQGLAQVILQRNRAGHYVANGRINGEPVVFLLDTGSTDVALPLLLARRLRLQLGDERVARTASGTVRSWSARLDSVDLGGLGVRDVPASVLPDMPGEQVLLGMSFLKHFELIQRGNTLTLRPPG